MTPEQQEILRKSNEIYDRLSLDIDNLEGEELELYYNLNINLLVATRPWIEWLNHSIENFSDIEEEYKHLLFSSDRAFFNESNDSFAKAIVNVKQADILSLSGPSEIVEQIIEELEGIISNIDLSEEDFGFSDF